MESIDDKTIVNYWDKIAPTWTSAVRNEEIESRTLVTNRAIVEAVLSRSPGSVLDIGCGEGWLARALAQHKIHVIGIDAIASLIEQAELLGGGRFSVVSYEELIDGGMSVSCDVVVCNFSLLGKESVEGVLRVAPRLLVSGGSFLVQTLHPIIASGESAYEDGWRLSPWTGFSDAFSDPSPWYFRTLESWVRLFAENDLRILEIREPVHPETNRPVSAIFIATPL